MLLAGDIGGTKTDLAIFSNDGGPYIPIAETKFHSANYASLEAIVSEFLAKTNIPVDRACFAVAGPVIGGRVKTTNLPWVVEESSLAHELNVDLSHVRVINDLEAIARAVPILRPGDVQTVNAGVPVPKGAIAVIAPGTGLGESFLTWDGSRYTAHSSEGGHSDFAPTDARQIRLLEYMFQKFEHVSFEHVCSGIGIPNLYRFLRDTEAMVEEPGVVALIATAADPSMVIIDQAANNGSKLCVATMELFASILASEAGNLAVKVLATGGIYVAGGVAVHAMRAIDQPDFLQHFTKKGRFSDMMKNIPLHVVLTSAGLTGAAAYGLENPIPEPALT